MVSGETQGKEKQAEGTDGKQSTAEKKEEKNLKRSKETEINEGFEEKTRKERGYTKRRHNISSGKRLPSELTKLTINKTVKPDEIQAVVQICPSVLILVIYIGMES